jgi:hypothetical protein
MNTRLHLEKNIIEAWGQWWIEWQDEKKEVFRKQLKERVRRQAMSPRAFVDEHLGSQGLQLDELVSSK